MYVRCESPRTHHHERLTCGYAIGEHSPESDKKLFPQVRTMGVQVGSRLRNGNSHRQPTGLAVITLRRAVPVLRPARSGSCPGAASASWTGIRVPSGLTARTGTLTSRTPRSSPEGDVHVPSNCHDIRHDDRWTSVAAQIGVTPPRGRSSKRRRGPTGTRGRVPLVPPHCT